MANTYHATLKIEKKYLDVFGHVNNAAYLELYEKARWEILEDYDLGLADIERQQKGPVILEINIKFRKELLENESIAIETTFAPLKGNTLCVIKQLMRKESGEVASTADFICGIFDLKKRKLSVIPPEWMDMMGLS